MLFKTGRGQEPSDHPVTHLFVVSSDSYEGRLNKAAFDTHQRSKQIELAFDLVYGLFLVGDYPQHCCEVA
jgi:hypothetical protein